MANDKNFVDTDVALAVAIQAFRINKQRVVKTVWFEKDQTPTEFANKTYLSCHFNVPGYDPEHKPEPIEVTPELLEEARSLKQYLTHTITMITLMRGGVQPFMQDVFKAVENDKCHIKDFGIIAWAPKLQADGEKQQMAKSLSAMYEKSSKWFGKENEVVTLNFNIIEKRFLRNYECWAAYGYNDEGNLVFFMTKHEKLCVSGAIKGRIKTHKDDHYHGNAKVTTLNFVKAI